MNEEKVYLVWYIYDDGFAHDSNSYQNVLMVFNNKEKAENFCKNNSDEIDEDGDYVITKPKDIILNNEETIKIKEADLDDGMYYLSIDERIIRY